MSLLSLTTLLVALVLQDPASAARGVQVSAKVTPERPGVGEPIMVELRVRAPAGSDVRFPALPDSTEAIEPLDPRAMREASTTAFVDRTAVYRLIAWDTGARPLRFADITVSVEGAERRYPVALPPLRIRSVLPADSSGRIPKPPRGPLEVNGRWWRLWVAGAVVALLLFWIWRSRRRRGTKPAHLPDAARIADEGFTHAASLSLLDAGEPGRHALAHVAVMRHYLAQRFPQAHPSRTAREVAAALTGAEFPILPERVMELLLRAEPVAFARAAVTRDEATAIATEARAIVRDVETAWRARHAGRGHGRGRKAKRRAS